MAYFPPYFYYPYAYSYPYPVHYVPTPYAQVPTILPPNPEVTRAQITIPQPDLALDTEAVAILQKILQEKRRTAEKALVSEEEDDEDFDNQSVVSSSVSSASSSFGDEHPPILIPPTRVRNELPVRVGAVRVDYPSLSAQPTTEISRIVQNASKSPTSHLNTAEKDSFQRVKKKKMHETEKHATTKHMINGNLIVKKRITPDWAVPDPPWVKRQAGIDKSKPSPLSKISLSSSLSSAANRVSSKLPGDERMDSEFSTPKELKRTNESITSTSSNDGGSSKVVPRSAQNSQSPVSTTLDTKVWASLDLPESLLNQAQQIYLQVKDAKDMKSPLTFKKPNATFGAVLYILCRQASIPRTFSEISQAAGVTKRELGQNYRFLVPLLTSEFNIVRRVRTDAFMKRWCQHLDLPPYILPVSVHAFQCSDNLSLFSGKCPTSVAAACIWMAIWASNRARALLKWSESLHSKSVEQIPADGFPLRIPVELKSLANVAGVVAATLTSTWRGFVPYWEKLIPKTILKGIIEGHVDTSNLLKMILDDAEKDSDDEEGEITSLLNSNQERV